MRTLLVFDDDATPEAIVSAVAGSSHVDLFPLTSRWDHCRAIERLLETRVETCHRLDVPRLVDAEVTDLRRRLPAWSHELAERVVDGRSVAAWLRRKPGFESAFWLGSIAEKNPLKTPELFVVAQVRAVDRQVAEGGYQACRVLLGGRLLRQTLVDVASAHGVSVAAVAPATSWRARVRSWLEEDGAAPNAVAAWLVWFRFLVWGLVARGLTFGRKGHDPPAILFVTYFPYVDRGEAAAGRFVNRYAGPLQDRLTEGGSVWWLGLFVFIDGRGFREAARLARRFVSGGDRLALLEAYGTPSVMGRVLLEWWRLSRRARRLRQAMTVPLSEGLLPESAEALARRLWRRSYEGIDLLRGLYYGEVCERAVAEARDAKRCLYLCEMQTWEHALVAAARRVGVQTMGYQHTSVSRNYYFYSQAPGQLDGAPEPDGLAVPDQLVANGERPRALLGESGYPGLVMAESVRYLGVRTALATDRPPHGGRPVVLIAGSIIERETAALLSLVATTWPVDGTAKLDDLTLWLKGHPSQPIAPVATRVGLALDDPRVEIRQGDISTLLPQVDLVVVPTSAVAIEALAYGCEVVVPVFGTFPAMTPLAGFDEVYHRVHSPDELRRLVARHRAEGPRVDRDTKRAFVESYWCLDPSLARWSRLLGLDDGSQAASPTAGERR